MGKKGKRKQQPASKGKKGKGRKGGGGADAATTRKDAKAAKKAEAALSKQERRRRQREERRARRKQEGQRWASESDKLKAQLKPLGLVVRDVTPDGNCFFRSIADQLLGAQAQHAAVRARLVAHMRSPTRRPDFEPFVVLDDETFDECVRPPPTRV